MGFKTPNPKVKMENGIRVNDIGLFGGMGSDKGKRKASDYETAIQQAKTGMTVESPGPGGGRGKMMKALGQLDRVDLGESIYMEDIHKRVEEEGIGVSPRGKKIVKYSGKG